MDETERTALTKYGWTIECESPLEISKNNARATGEAAELVIDALSTRNSPVGGLFDINSVLGQTPDQVKKVLNRLGYTLDVISDGQKVVRRSDSFDHRRLNVNVKDGKICAVLGIG